MSGFAGQRQVPLWLFCVPVAAWGLHFLAVYAVAAIYCAKTAALLAAVTTPTATAHSWIAVITLLTLAIYAFAARRGYGGLRRSGSGSVKVSPDENRFLGSIVLMLCGLSAAATIVVASVPFFFGDCR